MFKSKKKKKTTAETHRMLEEAVGDNAMSQSKTFFFGTNTSRTDERLSTRMIVAKVREAILADPR